MGYGSGSAVKPAGKMFWRLAEPGWCFAASCKMTNTVRAIWKRWCNTLQAFECMRFLFTVQLNCGQWALRQTISLLIPSLLFTPSLPLSLIEAESLLLSLLLSLSLSQFKPWMNCAYCQILLSAGPQCCAVEWYESVNVASTLVTSDCWVYNGWHNHISVEKKIEHSLRRKIQFTCSVMEIFKKKNFMQRSKKKKTPCRA